MDRHRQVVCEGEFEHDAVATAVFGDVGDAVGDGRLRRAEGEALAVERDLAGVRRREAEVDTGELGATGADESAEAENLAGPDLKGNVVHSGRAATDGPERERYRVPGGGLRGGIDLGDFAADHETDETGFVDVADGVRADALTVAQDGDAVGERENFLEAVGNINDANAVFAEVADDGEEEELLLLSEGRGGLVHDHDAGTGTECAGDFHELLLGHGEGANFGFRGNLGADAGEQLLGPGAAGGPIDPRAGGRGFEAEREIFGDGEVGEQGRLLVNAGDAERARG